MSDRAGYEQVVLENLASIHIGSFEIRLPGGEVRTIGSANAESSPLLTVRNPDFYRKVLLGGDIALGESYVNGDWDCTDLVSLFTTMLRSQEMIGASQNLFSWRGHNASPVEADETQMDPPFTGNHYDLGNVFFESILDPTMTYSCAVFDGPDDTLEYAQHNKIRGIIQKAQIRPDDHVLDLGSGWGSLGVEMVKARGCKVTAATLSSEQTKAMSDRVERAGLASRIEVRTSDYRSVEGSFDKIVAIELLEAVGHENYGVFFSTCERLLKPHGLMVVQVITIPDQRYDPTGCDWIQKHVFPGGLLPSLTVLCEAMTKHSQLMIEDLENVGPHYARTVRAWREAFTRNIQQGRRFSHDVRFLRKWTYYLSFCEAAFRTRVLNVLQLVLTRPGNWSLA